MGKLGKGLLAVLLAAISGALFALSVAPWGIWVEYVAGLALLLTVLWGRSGFATFGLGTVSGLVFFAPTIWWTAVSTSTLVAWIFLTLIEALYFGLFGYFASKLRLVPRWLVPLAVGVLWAAAEQLRSTWPLTGFPWATSAEATFDSIFSNLLPWGSVPLVAFAVGTFSALCAMPFFAPPSARLQRGRRSGSRLGDPGSGGVLGAKITAVVAMLVCVFGAGIWFDPQYVAAAGSESVKIGVVQGGVQQPWRHTFNEKTKVTRASLEGLNRGIESDPAQIYLLGETALDHDPRQDRETSLLMHGQINIPQPILFGTNNYFVDTTSELRRFNQVFVWQDGVIQKDKYSKRIPVPYGEYIPFPEIAGYFADLDALLATEVEPGLNPPNLLVPLEDGRQLNLAIGICFEVAFRDSIAQAVSGGGQFIYIPTNNSSFEDTNESFQQIKILRVRAKETARYAAQVSINGESALVDPHGKVLQKTDLNVPGYFASEVELRTQITPAVRYATQIYYVTYALTGAIILVIFAGYISTLKVKKNR